MSKPIKATIEGINVTITYKDQVANPWGDKDKAHNYHNCYNVTLYNPETKQRTSFKFYDSLHNTQTKDIYPEDLLYSVMSCIGCDYYYTKEYYPTFEDFANEFGYEVDSRSVEKTYRQCIKQGENLNRVIPSDVAEKIREQYQ